MSSFGCWGLTGDAGGGVTGNGDGVVSLDDTEEGEPLENWPGDACDDDCCLA